MMWNQNDTKYIIKRLILYALISCIVFFGAQSCAKAQVISSTLSNTTPVYYTVNGMSGTIDTNNLFANKTGKVLFQITMQNLTQTSGATSGIANLYVQSNSAIFMCNIGATYYYQDTGVGVQMLSVECPIQTTDGNPLNKIVINRTGTAGSITGLVSTYMTLTTEESESTAINNQIAQQMSSDAANTQAIVDRIYNSSQQEIYYNNQNAQQAHQDSQAQTDAINAQTQWQQQDFQFDTSWADSLDLFGNDTNYIRQLLLWPFTFALVIGQSLGGNSCNAYTFGSLYGTQITLPCINWKNYVGNTIYTTIDTIMGIVILFGVITYIRKVFEYVFSFGAKAYETVDVEVFK